MSKDTEVESATIPAGKGESVTDTTDFTIAFALFTDALRSENTAALNTFIDRQSGFWLIEQPGAVPAYTHYTSVQEVKRSYQQLPFTSINQEISTCHLQHRETLPGFDCGVMDGNASGYTEDGCFYTHNTTSFRNTTMWQYASLTEQQGQEVQKLQQQVTRTVLHTASNFRFHFGYLQGHWRLLFADLRIPCSA